MVIDQQRRNNLKPINKLMKSYFTKIISEIAFYHLFLGNSIEKVVSLSTMLFTDIFPLCCSTMALAIDSPSPYPPLSLARDLSVR